MDISVLFVVFNRLDYTQKVFEQIRKIKPNRFYISCDGPRKNVEGDEKKVNELRTWLLDNIDWECEVKTRFLDDNFGGWYAVSSGISWFFCYEKEGIILEDDCVPHESFFYYCKELLEKYREDKRIWQISGNNFFPENIHNSSYYFGKLGSCWGWATWRDRWIYFALDFSDYDKKYLNNLPHNLKLVWKNILNITKTGETNAWDFKWTLTVIKWNGLFIQPAKNLVTNIGELGQHFNGPCELLNRERYNILPLIHPDEVVEDLKFIKSAEKEAEQQVEELKKQIKLLKNKLRYKHWYEKIISVQNVTGTFKKALTICGMVFYFNKIVDRNAAVIGRK